MTPYIITIISSPSNYFKKVTTLELGGQPRESFDIRNLNNFLLNGVPLPERLHLSCIRLPWFLINIVPRLKLSELTFYKTVIKPTTLSMLINISALKVLKISECGIETKRLITCLTLRDPTTPLTLKTLMVEARILSDDDNLAEALDRLLLSFDTLEELKIKLRCSEIVVDLPQVAGIKNHSAQLKRCLVSVIREDTQHPVYFTRNQIQEIVLHCQKLTQFGVDLPNINYMDFRGADYWNNPGWLRYRSFLVSINDNRILDIVFAFATCFCYFGLLHAENDSPLATPRDTLDSYGTHQVFASRHRHPRY
ncbi:uncharacterized protein K452DRAFT_103638 [Aplosporella prunicola CBS 121167]|uniref:Uncharacterized protein n=1 Tax=Aplosporella prunicola CBS 121167 TaxID=1176127 RepID=A0A6A6BQA8_9PEZI|nr:uncharacterized protein K452DRAFT_103638 [Aplosporella prunicola CBS 121167]KAF2145938.1 hypothetical protein K452DRAFT_103638 [Aplosporella prunicola CBS 121167]